MLVLIEAINSVAIEHDPKCDCRTCRAAAGDQKALVEILLELKRPGVDVLGHFNREVQEPD